MTDISGALLNGGAPNTYDEYGVPGPNYGRFQYTGQMWIPELGVYSYKARMYSPTLGRFFQTDPAGYKDDLDWYAYVGDDPTDKTDPTGNDGCPDTQKIGGWVYCWSDDGGNHSNTRKQPSKFEAAIVSTISDHTTDNFRDYLQGMADELIGGLQDGAFDGVPLGRFGSAAEDIGGDAAKIVEKVCCFAAGTLIDTDRGLRPIEQIKVGDRVRSRDVATGVTEYKAVTALIRPHDRQLYEVRLKQAQTGLVEVFSVTDDHPWMSGDGHWLTTLQLVAGGRIQTEDHHDVQVVSVTKTKLTADTYNLDVADFHTYFVGKERVWVHNACSDLVKAARDLGYKLDKGFGRMHGQDVFKNGSRYITRDIDSHSGGAWKMFDRLGNRLGTFDKDLNRIGD